MYITCVKVPDNSADLYLSINHIVLARHIHNIYLSKAEGKDLSEEAIRKSLIFIVCIYRIQ